jgi:DNA helicase-2/ATP-dependent DNA helicase PcrA
LVERDYPHLLGSLEDLLLLFERYVGYKRERALVDYDDLLIHLRDLLSGHEEVQCQLSERYRYILVDEYQDTNRLQAQIVRLLAATHDNVMVVGDDAQSIYSFRGAFQEPN